jgi:hypothetical protein
MIVFADGGVKRDGGELNFAGTRRPRHCRRDDSGTRVVGRVQTTRVHIGGCWRGVGTLVCRKGENKMGLSTRSGDISLPTSPFDPEADRR